MPKTNETAKTTATAAKAKAPATKPAATPKAATPDPDTIVSSKAANPRDQATHVITSLGGQTHMFSTDLWTGDVRKACAPGQSFKAAVALVKATKLPAQLATGVKARDANHSAKAVSDNAAKAKAQRAAESLPAKAKATKATNKADAATQKPKSKSTAGVVSTRDGAAVIKVIAKENPYKPGTKAADTFDLFAKAGTVDGFKKLVAKNPSKYDAGYIRYSSRDGHIKVG